MKRTASKTSPLWLAMLLISMPTALRAETVYLKDGSTLVGALGPADGETIQLTTAYGVLKIEKNRIAAIDYLSAAKAPMGPPMIRPSLELPAVEESIPKKGDQSLAVPLPEEEADSEPERVATPARIVFSLGAAVSRSRLDTSNVGGGKDSILGNGPFYALQAYSEYNAPFGFGFELSEIVNGQATSTALIPHSYTTTSGSTTSLMALLRLSLFSSDSPVYIFGAFGGQTSSFKLTAAPQPGYPSGTRDIIDGKANGYAYALGFGLEGHIRPTLLLGAELRLQAATGGSFPATQQAMANGYMGVTQSTGDSILAARLTLEF